MVRLDAEEVERRLAVTEPRRSGLLLAFGMAIGALLALLILPVLAPRVGLPADAGTLAGAVMMTAAGFTAWGLGRRQRKCRAWLSRTWELVQLEEWEQAAILLDRGLSRPIIASADRMQAFMLLAAVAENEGAWEAAVAVYEALLLRGIYDPIAIHKTQIALAAAKIHTQQLTDAVNLLAQIEQQALPPELRAAVDLVRLFQQVFMGHHQDAVQNMEERRELYRRVLSTAAGYGYALLAVALHNLGRTADAARLWADATTLVRADRLVAYYPIIRIVSAAHPATERPQ